MRTGTDRESDLYQGRHDGIVPAPRCYCRVITADLWGDAGVLHAPEDTLSSLMVRRGRENARDEEGGGGGRSDIGFMC
jgi:hypothetical protein